MFKKILIANRGEIACRVAATARRMAIRTVAVYSNADAHANHVRACDESVHIGGSAPKDSYLRWEKILEAAKATGAEAVHPGYGFLSENEEFAQACADAGLVFIGPPPLAIISLSFSPDAVLTVILIEVAFMIESVTSPMPNPPCLEPASSPAPTIVGSPFGFCLRSVS